MASAVSLLKKAHLASLRIEQKGKLSLRASVTSELILEDCKIPSDAILPESKGIGAPLSCLNQARYGIAWGAIGAAMACYDEAVTYAKTRIQFDKPIASFQMIQEKLVYMLDEITKGQLLYLQLGRLKDEGKVHRSTSFAREDEQCLSCASDCHEPRAIFLAQVELRMNINVGRHMCNLESVFTYEGTHNIHTLVLGEWITGIPLSRI